MKNIYIDWPDGTGKTPFARIVSLTTSYRYSKFPKCKTPSDVAMQSDKISSESGLIVDRSPFWALAWHMAFGNREHTDSIFQSLITRFWSQGRVLILMTLTAEQVRRRIQMKINPTEHDIRLLSSDRDLRLYLDSMDKIFWRVREQNLILLSFNSYWPESLNRLLDVMATVGKTT